MALSASFSFSGSGIITGQSSESSPVDQVAIGANGFPAIGFDLADGNSNLQAQRWYHETFLILPGANQDIDLSGSLFDKFGAAIAFRLVKMIIVVIASPDGVKRFRFGPQGAANAAQLGFGGVAATNYIETDTFIILPRPYGGWAVTAGTADIARINNPSAVNVTVTVWILATETP